MLTPKTMFAIASSDRPVRSANLRLCRDNYPFAYADGRWEVSVLVTEEDCDNVVSVLLQNGSRIHCSVDYVTGEGFPTEMHFHIKQASCETESVHR